MSPTRVTITLSPRAFRVLSGLAKIGERSLAREGKIHLESALVEKRPVKSNRGKGDRI